MWFAVDYLLDEEYSSKSSFIKLFSHDTISWWAAMEEGTAQRTPRRSAGKTTRWTRSSTSCRSPPRGAPEASSRDPTRCLHRRRWTPWSPGGPCSCRRACGDGPRPNPRSPFRWYNGLIIYFSRWQRRARPGKLPQGSVLSVEMLNGIYAHSERRRAMERNSGLS